MGFDCMQRGHSEGRSRLQKRSKGFGAGFLKRKSGVKPKGGNKNPNVYMYLKDMFWQSSSKGLSGYKREKTGTDLSRGASAGVTDATN